MAKMVKPEVQIIRFGEDVIATSEPTQTVPGAGDGPVNTPGSGPSTNPWP